MLHLKEKMSVCTKLSFSHSKSRVLVTGIWLTLDKRAFDYMKFESVLLGLG